MTATAPQAGFPRTRPKDRKRQIVLHARDLFVERGFPGVSMSSIAERVGISAGALYRHFPSKAALLQDVFADSFSYLSDPIAADDFEAFVDTAVQRVGPHPYVGELWARESRYLPKRSQEELRGAIRAWTHAFIPPLASHRPALDAGQAELLAWAFQSALACLAGGELRVEREARRSSVRDAIVRLAAAELEPTGSPRQPPRSGVLPASRRERVLLAAVAQFGERGFREVSMADIGAEAGVTGPNLYGYFESKAHLLQAVYERGVHAAWLALDRALSTASSPEEAIEHLVASHLELPAVWTRVRGDLVAHVHDAEAVRTAQREYVAEWVVLLRELDPALEPGEARLRVAIALATISDLTSTPRLAQAESFAANVAILATAILKGGSS